MNFGTSEISRGMLASKLREASNFRPVPIQDTNMPGLLGILRAEGLGRARIGQPGRTFSRSKMKGHREHLSA